MKKIGVMVLGFAGLLVSCENPVRMETKVNEDGSLDKTIVLEKTDKFRETSNMFGISKDAGWEVKLDSVKKITKIEVPDTIDSRNTQSGNVKDDKYYLTFKKSFPSAEVANAELDKNIDSLFRINAQFEKRFRWFYTYIRYSETFRPIDRFKLIDPKDYFNLEDSLFIDRLPGEGTAISKADSFFLQQLNEKIFDRYAEDGLYREYFAILTEAVKRNTNDKKWIDTLNRKKDFLFQRLDDMNDDPGPAFLKLADSLGIPLAKEKFTRDFLELSRDINSRINFMSFARDGKYMNVIEMPWTVVNSNADSLAGNKLYWRPLTTRFAIQEYTMFAECRRLNFWAVGTSVIILGLTLFLLMRPRVREPRY
jgi:hypothetical protein